MFSLQRLEKTLLSFIDIVFLSNRGWGLRFAPVIGKKSHRKKSPGKNVMEKKSQEKKIMEKIHSLG